MATEADLHYQDRALELAALGGPRTAPNPQVGAVLVRRVAGDREVVGEGYHVQVGGPHAEAEALGRAGERARGATAYVTLEPCSHHGRTPPCADALVAAGVVRVVACHRDPNPLVAGRGFERLRRAGVQVEVGARAEEALRLNLGFATFHALGRPAVTLKWAMSLDGRIATVAGQSQWISGPEGRIWSQEQREAHDAILVGSGTVLADDPRLNRRSGGRSEGAGGTILRVFLDRRLRTPAAARWTRVPGPVVIYSELGGDEAAPGTSLQERRRALERAGAEVVDLGPGGVQPEAVVRDLHKRGIQNLLVEGGARIHGAFVEAGIFDRVAVNCAPKLLGGADAPGPVAGAGFAELAQAPRLAALTSQLRGEDLILTALRDRCLPDLLQNVAD